MATKAQKKTEGKTLTIVQTASGMGRKPGQLENLKGLGLGKVRRTSVLTDTPEVRGMIWKVRHLVRVEGEDGK